MTSHAVPDVPRFKVLFVDDEEKALKYFNKAFSNEMNVITASSVEEAVSILENEADSIGVLITDQRMPGKTGVTLLKHVRENYPNITRMLTTAYSELDDAISAVNSGEIFRYITKPWDLRILRGELLGAMDYFVAQHERDMLIREKMTVWKNFANITQLRDILIIAGNLSHLRYSKNAVNDYLRQLSPSLDNLKGYSDDTSYRTNIWDSLVTGVSGIHKLCEYIQEKTGSNEPAWPLQENVHIGQCLQELTTSLSGAEKVNIPSGSDMDSLQIRGNTELVNRLLSLLVQSVTQAMDDNIAMKLSVEQVSTGGDEELSYPYVKFNFAPEDAKTSTGQTCFPVFQSDLLVAFLICYHLGGRIFLNSDEGNFESIELRLPLDSSVSTYELDGQDWIKQLADCYESSLIQT